jgi:O-antigen/teichoic acid export membrane protein
MSIRRNALWNLLGAGAPLVLGAATIPYLISSVGIELVGLLTLVWALIGYFSLFDLGLSRALTQQLAATRASGQLQDLPTLMKTGVLLTALTGAVGGCILALLALPLSQQWLGISAHLQKDALYALLIAAIGIPMTTITNGLRGALEAYGEFKIVNLQRLVLGMTNFALPALSAFLFGASLSMMVLTLVAGRLVLLATHLHYTSKLIPFKWMQADIKRASGRRLYSFGLWMTVSNIVSPLIVYIDRFFISALLGASVVAYYAIPLELIVRVLIIPGALTAALFPHLASLFAQNTDEAMRLYHKCMRIVGLIMLPLVALIITGSQWGLTFWLGSEFSGNASLVLMVLSTGLFFNAIAQVPFAAIQAMGNAKLTAIIHCVELIIYIPTLYFSLVAFGLTGAAIVCSVRYALDAFILVVGLKKIVESKKNWKFDKVLKPSVPR